MSHPWQVQSSARLSASLNQQPPGMPPQLPYQQSQPMFQQQSQQSQQPPPHFQQQQQQMMHPPTLPMQQSVLQGAPRPMGMGSAPVGPFSGGMGSGPGGQQPLSLMGNPGGMSGSMGISSMPPMASPGSVTYPLPRRGMSGAPPLNVPPPNMGGAANGNAGGTDMMTPRTRVFTGTITKLYDNFGFVDGDVFFQTNVCTPGLPPKVGERALVDACFNPGMPFKWNATRLQVLPSGQDFAAAAGGAGGGVQMDDDRGRSRNEKRRDQRRNKDRDAEREAEREKRREERVREREKEREKEPSAKKARSRSPARRRSRSRSPPRRHARPVPKYAVSVPKISLDMTEASLQELRRRYVNLYVPSDFCLARASWVNVFPADQPLGLDQSCGFHVLHKDVEPAVTNDAVLEPPDADFTYSAKVMLLSLPSLEDLYRKACALAEDNQEGEGRDGFVHPTRLINFLVGSKGKSETMAIGGPWSPSLDGADPAGDPQVLIKTAVRTCLALTGIDLSKCTKWFRFVELHYRRSSGVVETVVIFLPDVWSCLPSREEWDGLQQNYSQQLARVTGSGSDDSSGPQLTGDSKDDKGSDGESKKIEPTHFSQLDVKTMKVGDLRRELEARGLVSKGLTSQLVARLTKVLKQEEESEVAAAAAAKAKEEEEKQKAAAAAAAAAATPTDAETKAVERKKREEEEKRRQEERERQTRERRYTLPMAPHILVHPSRTAKGGKFDCAVMSLSLLLDYRAEDTKEHSFEVSLCAEFFNEMLMRDFAFRIYEALVTAPEKPKEEEKEKRESKERSKKDSKEDSEKKDKKDKDERKDKEEKKEKEEDQDKAEKAEAAATEGEQADEEEGTEESSKKKSSERRSKSVTVDPALLLAFIYFDQTHCGYIFDKDMEEILHMLGLSLSRAQCRRLLQKVLTRDTFSYRKLTDRDSEPTVEQVDSTANEERRRELAAGNRALLPDTIPTSPPQGEEGTPGVVWYRGCLVDLKQLFEQTERGKKAHQDLEVRNRQLQEKLAACLAEGADSAAQTNKLLADLRQCKERLSSGGKEKTKAKSEWEALRERLVQVRNVLEAPLDKKVVTSFVKEEEPAKEEPTA